MNTMQNIPAPNYAQALVEEKKGDAAQAKKMYAQAADGWAKADSKFASKMQALKKAKS